MLRSEMENKVKKYITDDIHRLEDYADIDICCTKDYDSAVIIMNNSISYATDEELEKFCKAIDSDTVDYLTHGCR